MPTLPRFLQKQCFDTKLAKIPNFYDFKTIFGFCLSLLVESISTWKIDKIHENCSLDPFQAQEVIDGNLSPEPEKLKISKCSVSNQSSGEGWLWLIKVCYGLISPRKLLQTYIFMIQVKNIIFLESWVRIIQAPPNSVQWSTNSGSLILVSPNMSRKHRKCFHQSWKHCISLILLLLIDSSPCFWMKNKCFEI